jgi:hypothetical protein|eukprot:SAG25_NODE_955_length_4560_cov_121.642009_2_plen_44_part_00
MRPDVPTCVRLSFTALCPGHRNRVEKARWSVLLSDALKASKVG